MDTEVILVDEHDHKLGTMEKLAAHRQGRLHRAISVYVFNSRDELLPQRRATFVERERPAGCVSGDIVNSMTMSSGNAVRLSAPAAAAPRQ